MTNILFFIKNGSTKCFIYKLHLHFARRCTVVPLRIPLVFDFVWIPFLRLPWQLMANLIYKLTFYWLEYYNMRVIFRWYFFRRRCRQNRVCKAGLKWHCKNSALFNFVSRKAIKWVEISKLNFHQSYNNNSKSFNI